MEHSAETLRDMIVAQLSLMVHALNTCTVTTDNDVQAKARNLENIRIYEETQQVFQEVLGLLLKHGPKYNPQ